MTTLLYILMALPGGSWHGSVQLHETDQHGQCEVIKAQVERAPSTGMVYRCATVVVNR